MSNNENRKSSIYAAIFWGVSGGGAGGSSFFHFKGNYVGGLARIGFEGEVIQICKIELHIYTCSFIFSVSQDWIVP